MSIEVNASPEVRAKRQRLADLSADQQLQLLLTKDPSDLNAWIDANVTDLDSIRVVMKRMLRLMIYLARQAEL